MKVGLDALKPGLLIAMFATNIAQTAISQEVLARPGEIGPVRHLSYSPDGKYLAVAADSVPKVWDVATKKVVASLGSKVEAYSSVAFSPDGLSVAVSGRSDMRERSDDISTIVDIWDTRTWQKKRIVSKRGLGEPCHLSFLSNGEAIIVLIRQTERYGGHFFVFKAKSGDQISKSPLTNWHSSFPYGISTDGKSVFYSEIRSVDAATPGSAILKWDIGAAKERLSIEKVPSHMVALAASSDGRMVAAAGGIDNWGGHPKEPVKRYPGTLLSWDSSLSGSAYPTPLEGHFGNVMSVEFSPDGKLLASGGSDGTVKLWNAHSKQLICTKRKHRDRVTALQFSPDGKILVSGGEDRKVLIWKLEELLQ